MSSAVQKSYLEDVCNKLNNSNFYIGFNTLTSHVKPLEAPIYNAYRDLIEGDPTSICIDNPNGSSTLLYEVPLGKLTAYPLCAQSDVDRFFSVCPYVGHNAGGIVLVSHKKKILSFVRWCEDFSANGMLMHGAFWFNCWKDIIREWMIWARDVCTVENMDYISMTDTMPNPMHSNYRDLCISLTSADVQPSELCLSVEDHFKNELFRHKVFIENRIASINDKIEASRRNIEDEKHYISQCYESIESLKSSLAKYEDDLYVSRVGADL